MPSLTHIWRHPIKGIGSEALKGAELTPVGAMLGDRAWAVLHQGAAEDTDTWQPRRNFAVTASGPRLAALRLETLGPDHFALTHPDLERLEVNLPDAGDQLCDWLAGIWPAERPALKRVVKAQGHGMTDQSKPWVSLGNLASLQALSHHAGQPLDMRRFRINLWIDGLDPWAEVGLTGDIQLGQVTLRIQEPIERCRAPDANCQTGQRDVGMLNLLEREYNTRDFGLFAEVLGPGQVSLGDGVYLP